MELEFGGGAVYKRSVIVSTILFCSVFSCSSKVAESPRAAPASTEVKPKPTPQAQPDSDKAVLANDITFKPAALPPEVEMDPTPEVIAPRPKRVSFLSEMVFATKEGEHAAVTFPYTPPTGYVAWAAAADCSGGTCAGYITVNLKYVQGVPTVDDLVAITDVKLSANEGDHVVDGGTCPAGFEALGSFTDCGAGTCSGHQKLCAKKRKISEMKLGEKLIVKIWKTPAGAHQAGGMGCPNDGLVYQIIGSHADCGNGLCSGNQIICVSQVEIKL